ncbi:hypothetical protein P0W64_16430 [Tsukamurella sp. 8F]|uniref:hypothetical protein n=1 Tax=unclassified Tsukamurella TaxID=2633480 RepID=UPI0023B8BBBA|nr:MULTISPECIES: hypothetical protein [unclassified Tsukamurella]MDF0531122.1 hypothetical protein [Tsukamurella sp. 8J]MDF0588368.1 hypothetical protein [Tsukamurella sp. 8F]
MTGLRGRWLVFAEGHRSTAWAMRAAATIWTTMLFLSLSAPTASAQIGTQVVGSAGLKDSYGVPLADYYISTVSVQDQLKMTLRSVGFNPAGWVPKLIEGLSRTMEYSTVTASLLALEVGAIVLILTLVLWVLKIALSALWLQWLANLGSGAVMTVAEICHQFHLAPFCFFVGLCAGAVLWSLGLRGRGLAVMAMTTFIALLIWTVFADPMRELYSPDGWMSQVRELGFSASDAVVHNGRMGSGSAQEHMQQFIGTLIDNAARRPVEVLNFGHVIDGNSGCAGAWNQAIMNGASDGPVKAMQSCGDNAAWNYAANLDPANVLLGALMIIGILVFGFFITTVALLVFLTGAKAWWWAIVITPLMIVGMVPGPPRHRALTGAVEVFMHLVSYFVLVAYLGVSAQVLGILLSDPKVTQSLGGDSALVRVLLMVIGSLAMLVLFHHVKKWLGMPATHTMWHSMRHPVASTRESVARHTSDFKPYSEGASRGLDRLRGGRETESGSGLDAMFRRSPVHKGSVGHTGEGPGAGRLQHDAAGPKPGTGADAGGRSAASVGTAGTESEQDAPSVTATPGARGADHAAARTPARAATSAAASRGGSAASATAPAAEAGAMEGAAAVAAPEVVVPAVAAQSMARRGAAGRGAAGRGGTRTENGQGSVDAREGRPAQGPVPSPPSASAGPTRRGAASGRSAGASTAAHRRVAAEPEPDGLNRLYDRSLAPPPSRDDEPRPGPGRPNR